MIKYLNMVKMKMKNGDMVMIPGKELSYLDINGRSVFTEEPQCAKRLGTMYDKDDFLEYRWQYEAESMNIAFEFSGHSFEVCGSEGRISQIDDEDLLMKYQMDGRLEADYLILEYLLVEDESVLIFEYEEYGVWLPPAEGEGNI